MKPAMSFNLFCGKHNTLPLKLLFYFLVHVSVLPNGRTAYVPQKHAVFSLLLLSILGVVLKFQKPDVRNCTFYSFLFFGRTSFFNFGAVLHYLTVVRCAVV